MPKIKYTEMNNLTVSPSNGTKDSLQ